MSCRKKLITNLSLMLLFGAVSNAQATPVQFEYLDTIKHNVSSLGLMSGEAAKITLSLDNGNSSLLSQTWSASDLLSVTFDFGDNSQLVTTFNSPFDGGLGNPPVGSLTTDASGALTSVMSDWSDFGIAADFTTNGTGADLEWFLTGNGGYVYFEGYEAVDLTMEWDSSGTNGVGTANNWSQSQVAAVPVPAAVWLMGSALAGLLGFRRKATLQK